MYVYSQYRRGPNVSNDQQRKLMSEPTGEMLADGSTKAVTPETVKRFVQGLRFDRET